MLFKKNYDFKDKVVLITGGSRGIGFATAKMFLENGAKVAICGINKSNLAKADREVKRVGELVAFRADVRKYKEVEEFVNKTINKFGKVDILVNNAGVAWSGRFSEEKSDNIDELVDINLKGVLYTSRAVLQHMIQNDNGVIINVSSGAGKAGIPGLATYCATKFAVVGFTEALAGEVKNKGIKVYGICPGAVATDMQTDVSGAKVGMPPKKIARKILELAGSNSPISVGECLEVYG